MPRPATDYEWLLDTTISEAGCITVVADADEERLCAALGAAREPSGGTGFPVGESGDWAWLHRGDTATVVVEDNGFQGSRSEVLGPVSKSSAIGKAASVFWNVNGIVSFTCARRGKTLGAIELIGITGDELDGIPNALHRLALSANDHDINALSIGAAMVAAFTGVDFGPEILDDGDAHPITPVAADLRDWRPGMTVPFVGDHPGLVEAVRDTDPASQRALARFAATAAATEAGLAHNTSVQQLLSDLATRATPPIPGGIDALKAQLYRQADEIWTRETEDGAAPGGIEGVYLRQQLNALEALRHATHPEPVSAAMVSLWFLLAAVSGTRTSRGTVYRTDNTGRWIDHFEDLTEGRTAIVVAAAQQIIAATATATEALSGIPEALTTEERELALRNDAAAVARGDHLTYQIVAAGPPPPGLLD